MAVYTRESDGAVLDYSHVLGSFDRIIGVYDFSRASEFSYGEHAEAREIASYLEQKTFTIDLIMSDTTGVEQIYAMEYFKRGGKYLVTGPEFSLDTMGFYVVAIDTKIMDSGPDVITMTCQAEFGDFVEETIVPINSQSLAAGAAYPGWVGNYWNQTSETQTIRFKLEKASAVTLWTSQTSTRILRTGQGLAITTGGFSSLGELQDRAGRRIIVDSYAEVIEGEAVISPMSAVFFKVKPGETVSLTVEPMTPPTADAYTADIYAHSIKLRSHA